MSRFLRQFASPLIFWSVWLFNLANACLLRETCGLAKCETPSLALLLLSPWMLLLGFVLGIILLFSGTASPGNAAALAGSAWMCWISLVTLQFYGHLRDLCLLYGGKSAIVYDVPVVASISLGFSLLAVTYFGALDRRHARRSPAKLKFI